MIVQKKSNTAKLHWEQDWTKTTSSIQLIHKMTKRSGLYFCLRLLVPTNGSAVSLSVCPYLLYGVYTHTESTVQQDNYNVKPWLVTVLVHCAGEGKKMLSCACVCALWLRGDNMWSCGSVSVFELLLLTCLLMVSHSFAILIESVQFIQTSISIFAALSIISINNYCIGQAYFKENFIILSVLQ